jgi:hypothetical protein
MLGRLHLEEDHRLSQYLSYLLLVHQEVLVLFLQDLVLGITDQLIYLFLIMLNGVIIHDPYELLPHDDSQDISADQTLVPGQDGSLQDLLLAVVGSLLLDDESLDVVGD